MKLYKGEEIRTVESGWYWVTKFEGDSPQVINVSRCATRIELYFGYCCEKHIHFDGRKGDHYEGITLFGPIEVPKGIKS